MTRTPQEEVPPEQLAEALLTAVRPLDGLVVAFSGGVDSTVVLAAAVRALGPRRTLAATADSPALARDELALARRTAAELGAELAVLATDELAVPGYRANQGDRCYFCKRTVLSRVAELAAERGYAHVATGTHADDRRSAHRPGLRAAGELGVVEPLVTAGLGKAGVRAVARAWGLPVADKPGSPCLASRVAVGVPVSRERLALIEHTEAAVRTFLHERLVEARDVRVRLLPEGFRIEVDAVVHQWLERRPAEANALLGRVARMARTGDGTIAEYRSGAVSTLTALAGRTRREAVRP
ncbi:asparagine synthase-related protein [Streptomyces lavendofoliae]|uniref:asparagine synthase-related protein n=1 Tax=Streptomyces lavendofoliae TaxID=67314 RepID=UPI003D915FC0